MDLYARKYYSGLPFTVRIEKIRMNALWSSGIQAAQQLRGGPDDLIHLPAPWTRKMLVQMARPVDVFITLIDPRESRSAWGRVGACTLLCEPFTVRRMDSTASKAPETEYSKAVKTELYDTITGGRGQEKQSLRADMSVIIQQESS